MAAWSDALPYFSKFELRCKLTGEIRLDVRFAAALPALRLAWGSPLHPTSVCRSPEHNAAANGHPRSLHLTENPVHPTDGTMAADIDWLEWPVSQQQAFYLVALSEGWAVGLHPSFVHVDRRGDVGLPVITFHYAAWDQRFPNAAQ